tara:strand:+ start:4741 stop:6072 length:1332 start_codon:yes stop_codon:yes gene_type:complete
MDQQVKPTENKPVITLTVFMVLLFIGVFLYTAFYQTLSADDFYFASYIKEYGVWESMQLERSEWNSRWSSLLLNFSLLKLNQNFPFTFLLYGLVNLSCTFYLFKVWFSKSASKPLVSASLATLLLFFGTINIGEVWFWSCSTTAYLTSTLLVAILYLKLGEKLSVKTGLLLVFAVIYIGGSSMPIALLALFILIKRLIAQLKGDQQNIQWIILLTLVLLVSFLYLLNGEGSYKRQLAFEAIPLIDLPFLHIKLVGIIMIKSVLPQLLPLFLLGIPFLFLPSNLPSIKASKVTGTVAFYVIQFGLALFIYQGIFTFVTNDISAARSLFPINLLLVFYVIKTLLLLHQYLKSKEINNLIKSILITISLITLCLIIVKNVSKDVTYKRAYNQVISNLERNQTVVNPLPETGFIYNTTISKDSNYFTNQHLKKYFELSKTPITNDTN